MRICVVAYTFYEYDNRVRRYADTLAKRGDEVDVIALRYRDRPSAQVINGVRIFQIQRREINERRRLTYLLRLTLFFVRAMLLVTKRHLQNRYDLFHIHSVPDFLVFTAWLPKLMGAKVILDIHDLLPELYASKFRTTCDSPIVKFLIAVERASAAFADHVIVANHIWQQKLFSRSIKDPHKCTAILNFPDQSIFCRHELKKSGRKFVFMYPGTLSYHQGVDTAIRAFTLIRDDAPHAEFHIYGDGEQKGYLRSLIAELGLQERVFLMDLLPLTEISAVMANADVGVVPKRKDSFGNEAFSTKILEFMAVGVPVIVSDTKIDKYYFDESLVTFFQSDDEKHLADRMLLLIQDGKLRSRLVSNAEEFIKKNNWEVKKAEYLKLVDERLISTSMRNIYYLLRPAIPWALRMALRRIRARRLRRRFSSSWPINEAAARAPEGWPGWPDGKEFAFVLTHDVEGKSGLDRCRELAEMEMRLGFRSSFNFVPEGEYTTPESLRGFLTAHGFEVGVHDLRHDGTLYRSRKSFRADAEKINRYLETWGGVGFRSGFMLHNLDWLHDLNILYDASTFDTDPFEPQPDGVNTIFPFRVSRNGRSGYVELPYTLPQDSTLFLVLRETSIDTWVRKLDWVAQHGGLALVIVHPDYMNFNGRRSPSEYRAQLYQDLLAYVANRYRSKCWFALPRDVAKYVCRHKSAFSEKTIQR